MLSYIEFTLKVQSESVCDMANHNRKNAHGNVIFALPINVIKQVVHLGMSLRAPRDSSIVVNRGQASIYCGYLSKKAHRPCFRLTPHANMGQSQVSTTILY